LNKAGYFNEENKKPLPNYPEHIAIITSPTGAAVRDILITLKKRYPIAKTTIIPTSVQGELATGSIVQAIERANNINDFDCIILGIGHETDITISDYIADLRAQTTTGAAQLAVPSLTELVTNNKQLQERLLRSITQLFRVNKDKLTDLQEAYVFKNPRQLFLN